MSSVTVCSDFGAQENKICHRFHFFPIYLPWSDGTGCHGLSFWMLSFKPAFSLSPSSGGSLVPLLFLPLKWYLLRYIQNLYLDILTSESELLKLVSILPLHIVYLSDSWNNMAIPGGLLKPTLNCPLCASEGFPLGSVVKSPLANVGDVSSIPGSRRSAGEGNGNPLQSACLGYPMDRGTWQAAVHEVAKESYMTWQLNSNSLCFKVC